MQEIKTYNEKAFLLPDSIRSCASYHAKVKPDGEYVFRIHDCLNGIRLRGLVTSQEEVEEAIQKLCALAEGALKMAEFIRINYHEESHGNHIAENIPQDGPQAGRMPVPTLSAAV